MKMAKVKLTKTELKAQTDALKRFERFLPMLQLKKQQLQAEIAEITARLEEVEREQETAMHELESWVALFADADETLHKLIKFNGVRTDTSNIAGVTIPVYRDLNLEVSEIDLFETPAWIDDGVNMITVMLEFKARRAVLERQRDLITSELNTTSQRVNLFEKVKIPECRENIRVIKIAIGDEQTAAVTRGKIAKGRSRARDEEDAA